MLPLLEYHDTKTESMFIEVTCQITNMTYHYYLGRQVAIVIVFKPEVTDTKC